MDLRAPLHDVNEFVGDGKSSMSSSKFNDNHGGTAPWVHQSNMPSTFDTRLYERIIYHHLCRMYIASQSMELGSESRFTGLVLFHRYARRFYCLVQQSHQQQQQPTQGQQLTQELNQIKHHLGPVAAACLFLGCKMEEEPRRIRDVLNLSHLLNVSAWDNDNDDDSIIGPPSSLLDAQEPQPQPKLKIVETTNRPITVIESPHPPPLDESYWTAKEQMVSTEQHVLRMIRFDTTVCHPHRCVLTIMETLGFGTGNNNAGSGKDDQCDTNWLLDSEQSENVILRAWRILNETPLDPRGIVLSYPVIVLSCAVISLAAEGGIVESDDKKDDGKTVTLPDFWWRALDVSTKDITMAREALQKVLR